MTNRFDPAHLEQHLQRSARLRSQAIFAAFGALRNAAKRAAHHVIAIFA